MRAYLAPLMPFQRLFVPALLVLSVWAIWRMVFKKDLAIGLAFYLGLVIIVDSFMNTALYLPGLEKGSIRYSEICAVFLFMSGSSGPPRRSIFVPVCLFVSGYFALMAFSVFRADSPLAALMEFRATVFPQIVALVIALRSFRSEEDFRRFLKGLVVIAVFAGLFTFWDLFFDRWIIRSDMLYKPIYAHTRGQNRFGSIFLNPNYFGAFVTLLFPAVFVWAMNEKDLRSRLYAGLAMLVLVFSLVQTQSRAPLLAFAIGVLMLVMGPCGSVSRRRRLGFLAAFIVVFTLALPGFYTRAIGRFDQIEVETSTENALSRQTTWLYTLRIVGQHPIAGIGFGEAQFIKAMSDIGFEYDFGIESLDAPHNSYLQAAVYAGVPALALFVLANVVLLVTTAFNSLRGNRRDTATLFGLFVGLLAFLASIFPDVQLFTPNVGVVYWVFFGLLLSMTTSNPDTNAAPAAGTSAVAVPLTWQPPRQHAPAGVSSEYLAALRSRRERR